MIKRAQTAFLIIFTAASITTFSDLSAQIVYENPPRTEDFSTFSTKLIEAKTTFNVSSEIVEALSSTESYETMGALYKDGSPQKFGLSISPPRIVFENGEKTAEMTISNIGSVNTIYRVLLVNSVFDENGQRTLIETDMQAEYEEQVNLFADKMIKFAPRWVRLKPTEQQLIRVAAVVPDNLQDGEYRSELKFSWQQDSEELVTPGSLEENFEHHTASSTESNTDKNTVSKELFIPLIIRQGNPSATAQLTQLELESSDESTVLNLKILRKGNRSIYGDLLISGLNKQNEKSGILHTVSNLAVYPPALQLNLSVDLTEALSKDGKNIDSLIIEYKAKGNADNNVIASSVIKLLNGARVSTE